MDCMFAVAIVNVDVKSKVSNPARIKISTVEIKLITSLTEPSKTYHGVVF